MPSPPCRNVDQPSGPEDHAELQNMADYHESSDEEEDPVVIEIPVVLSHFSDADGLCAELFGVKYPTRPTYRPYCEKEALDQVEIGSSQRLRFTYLPSSQTNKSAKLHGRNAEHESAANSRRAVASSFKLRSTNVHVCDAQGFVGAMKDGEVRVSLYFNGVLSSILLVAMYSSPSRTPMPSCCLFS